VGRLYLFVYTECLVFVCLFELYLPLQGALCACVFCTNTVCSVLVCSVATHCVQSFSAVPTNFLQWFVLCMYTTCLNLVCFLYLMNVFSVLVLCTYSLFLVLFSWKLRRFVKFSSEIFRELFLQFAMCCTVGLATQSMFCLLPDFSRVVQFTLSTLLCWRCFKPCGVAEKGGGRLKS